MRTCLALFGYVVLCVSVAQCRRVYRCDFDNATLDEHCFTTDVLVFAGFGFLTDDPPHYPSSDVTSSLKPTRNGEVCRLPYKIGVYTWDMYFCYNNACPTETQANSSCTPGQFAAIELVDTQIRSLQLKTDSGNIEGNGEQVLTYYYYMSNLAGKRIQVRKEETDGSNEIVDTVINSPFNGWIKREVKFIGTSGAYKLYFDLQRTGTEASPIDIALDEIEIWQEDQTTTIFETSTQMETTDETLTEMIMTTTLATTSDDVFTAVSTSKSSDRTSTLTPPEVTTSPSLTTTDAITSDTVGITTSETDPTSVPSPTTWTSTTSETDPTSAPSPMTSTSTTTQSTTGVIQSAKPFPTLYIILLSTIIPLIVLILIGVIIRLKRPSMCKLCRRKEIRPSTDDDSDYPMNTLYSY